MEMRKKKLSIGIENFEEIRIIDASFICSYDAPTTANISGAFISLYYLSFITIFGNLFFRQLQRNDCKRFSHGYQQF